MESHDEKLILKMKMSLFSFFIDFLLECYLLFFIIL